MRRSFLPPRLRAPVVFLVVGLVVLAVGGAAYTWASAAYLSPVVIAAAVGYYLLAGRDTDAGAIVRREVDERLALRRLRVQAFVGRVLSVAVAVAYLVAVVAKATLWPWALLLAVLAVAFLAGWVRHGDRVGRGDDDPGRPDRPTGRSRGAGR